MPHGADEAGDSKFPLPRRMEQTKQGTRSSVPGVAEYSGAEHRGATATAQAMQREKIEAQKRFKQQGDLAIKAKAMELKEEEKLGRERKIELQKFIRLEQAELRKEQAEKQRKFLEFMLICVISAFML